MESLVLSVKAEGDPAPEKPEKARIRSSLHRIDESEAGSKESTDQRKNKIFLLDYKRIHNSPLILSDHQQFG